VEKDQVVEEAVALANEITVASSVAVRTLLKTLRMKQVQTFSYPFHSSVDVFICGKKYIIGSWSTPSSCT
jgi:hypothetical protein